MFIPPTLKLTQNESWCGTKVGVRQGSSEGHGELARDEDIVGERRRVLAREGELVREELPSNPPPKSYCRPHKPHS